MKISRQWLEDYVDLAGLGDAEISDRLTEIGHAVESVERHGDDTVFDVEFTSNRVDAMSHFGLARELAAATGRALRPPAPNIPELKQTGEVQIFIDAPELCTRYTGLVLHGVKVQPSEEKVQRRLDAVGLRPINNLVDATNYIMLALGHPIHAFDLSQIAQKTIRVRRGSRGETLKSLEGQLRRIDEQTCVIADAQRPLALGGIIGGANSEINENTRDVLLECAHFVPGVIRRTAKRLEIKTDASYRFERGVDPGDTVLAITAAAHLILQAGGERGDLVDLIALPPPQRAIPLRDSRLREASAGTVGIGFALELFRRLGMNVSLTPGGIQVTVPTYRGDLAEEDDLIEEAMRFFGYNNIPAALPRVSTGDVRIDPAGEAEERIRDILVGCGLTETVSYSFIHPDHNRRFSDEPPILITNALTENIASMRLSLFPGLLQAVAFNRGYGNRDGALFEVGRTYHADGQQVRERHVAAFVTFGTITTHWGDARRGTDYFDAKGYIEAVARQYHVELTFEPAERPFFRLGSVARSGETTIATAGVLARELLQRFDIKGDVVAGEIDIDRLIPSVRPWKMRPVSRFPGKPMVLSFLHPPELQYAEVVERIRAFEVPYLQDIGIWDRFVAAGSGEVKTALGMWYQAMDRTLTEEEVSAIHRQVAARLAAALPVRVIN